MAHTHKSGSQPGARFCIAWLRRLGWEIITK
jgi:hypothetical protein